MELVRLTTPVELFACEKQVYPLFEKYYEKAKHYIENLETPDIAWKNCVNKSPFPDYYFYLLREENKFIGFYIGYLLRMPYHTVLFTSDYYIPNKGVLFSKVLKTVMTVLGADEIWGEAPDNTLRLYRKVLKGSTVKTMKMVRIVL